MQVNQTQSQTDNNDPQSLHSDSTPVWEARAQPIASSSSYQPARGFGQAFGLHPIPAVMTLAVDAMLFGGSLATVGAIWPLALVVAAVLGFITFRAQMRFYGDDSEAAMIKALAVALLTAIPTSLPGFLTIPSAFVGIIHTLRRKN